MIGHLARIRRRGAAAPGFAIARPGGALAALLLAPLLTASLAAADTAPGESEEPSPAVPPLVVSDELTVTDTRLRGEPESLARVPAHVTVIEGDEIRGSGSRTLQELLALEAGVVVYDQVGNGLSRSFDLRGFTGTGTKVFLDGVPLNDPRSNALVLELVPVAALERVEITRGSTAALAGGGAEAGVVNLWTGGRPPGSSLAVAGGSFGSLELEGGASRDFGRADLFVAGSWLESDGFRDNAGGELRRLAAKLGYDLGGGRRLELAVLDAAEELGAPGALTAAELASDRRQAPFNRLDRLAEGLAQASLAYRAPLGSRASLTANLFARGRESEILTTGRAAPLFGGFFLDSEDAVAGATVQLEGSWGREGRGHRLSGGVEWLDGETDARGFFTPPGAPDRVDHSTPGSDNTAARRALGLFAQSVWSPAPEWSLVAGLRWDRDEVGYVERLPDPANRGERSYSELSLRAGASWSPGERTTLYLSYGEGFLAPTVEQLFSFPLFGSNADLRPEDSQSWELGARRRWPGGSRVETALFRIDTRDEIIFDPGSPIGLFGANVNAGRARRDGLEVSVERPLTGGARLFGALTLVEAELRSGPGRGNRLPLVPEERLALGFETPLGEALALRVDGLWVGEQVLDNDEANAQPPLAAYAVVNARLVWSPPFGGGSSGGTLSGGTGRGPRLFVEARNLLDERYESRGIYAFDFAAGSNEIFLTPAPGRRLMAGIEWRL